MRISDWSSDVCSSDLLAHRRRHRAAQADEPCRQADGDGVHLREATVDAVDDVEPVVLAELHLGQQRAALRHQRPARLGEDRHGGAQLQLLQIGRASCRERVCQYVYISVVAGSLKKKKTQKTEKEKTI